MRKLIFWGLFLSFAALVQGQDLAIAGSVEWERMEITASVALSLSSAGIRLPTGRAQAEELISTEYLRLIRPALLSIPVDSSSTVEDLINRGDFSLQRMGSIALAARRVPPALSTDMASLTASYTIDLTHIGAALIRHTRPQDVIRPLRPTPAAAYTGIVIIANETLPVHGRNTRSMVLPCLFPKVWDTGMNLIYERNMMESERAQTAGIIRYVSASAIFRPTPSGLSPELAGLVGTNPLRIIAREVYGIRPTDPIIDQEDARIILSSEENIRHLREGRVAIVLNEQALKNSF
jgi:hypothetical protein